jgi:lysozyme family protein
MTAQDYQPFVERMIWRYEGGYGWDRNDPGGPTKYGITCFDLAEYMHQTMDSMAHWAPIVKAMTLATADAIYAEKYATACAFNELGPGKDCCVFDFGVNSGPSRSIKTAQRIVGVALDGVLGPITLTAINAATPSTFIVELCNARLAFLRGLSTWSTFGRGWSARVADLKTYSLGLLAPRKAMTRFQRKPHRIPKAFGKGYAKMDRLGLYRQDRRR